MIFYQRLGIWKPRKLFASKLIQICKTLLEAYIMDAISGIKEVTPLLLAMKMSKEWS